MLVRPRRIAVARRHQIEIVSFLSRRRRTSPVSTFDLKSSSAAVKFTHKQHWRRCGDFAFFPCAHGRRNEFKFHFDQSKFDRLMKWKLTVYTIFYFDDSSRTQHAINACQIVANRNKNDNKWIFQTEISRVRVNLAAMFRHFSIIARDKNSFDNVFFFFCFLVFVAASVRLMCLYYFETRNTIWKSTNVLKSIYNILFKHQIVFRYFSSRLLTLACRVRKNNLRVCFWCFA